VDGVMGVLNMSELDYIFRPDIVAFVLSFFAIIIWSLTKFIKVEKVSSSNLSDRSENRRK